jgi:hypothetical protein
MWGVRGWGAEGAVQGMPTGTVRDVVKWVRGDMVAVRTPPPIVELTSHHSEQNIPSANQTYTPVTHPPTHTHSLSSHCYRLSFRRGRQPSVFNSVECMRGPCSLATPSHTRSPQVWRRWADAHASATHCTSTPSCCPRCVPFTGRTCSGWSHGLAGSDV